MPLKTTKTLPPGGWPFRQQLADGTFKKFESMAPFGEAVKILMAFRKGNNITPNDFESIALELEKYTCDRLGNNPQFCEVQKKTSLLSKLHVLPAHVKRAVERAEDVGNGVRILSDWLGDGASPVDPSLAQSRAEGCVKCPMNVESHGVMMLTDAIASAILEQRRKKSEMGFTTTVEGDLHTCSVCLCHLSLLVHVPIKTIANRTDQRLDEKYPDECWKKKELKAARVQSGVDEKEPTQDAGLLPAIQSNKKGSKKVSGKVEKKP